jgi:hypothetical protein
VRRTVPNPRTLLVSKAAFFVVLEETAASTVLAFMIWQLAAASVGLQEALCGLIPILGKIVPNSEIHSKSNVFISMSS